MLKNARIRKVSREQRCSSSNVRHPTRYKLSKLFNSLRIALPRVSGLKSREIPRTQCYRRASLHRRLPPHRSLPRRSPLSHTLKTVQAPPPSLSVGSPLSAPSPLSRGHSSPVGAFVLCPETPGYLPRPSHCAYYMPQLRNAYFSGRGSAAANRRIEHFKNGVFAFRTIRNDEEHRKNNKQAPKINGKINKNQAKVLVLEVEGVLWKSTLEVASNKKKNSEIYDATRFRNIVRNVVPFLLPVEIGDGCQAWSY